MARLGEGVIDVDQNQSIIHINDAAAMLLGVNRDRCMGKPLWQEVRNQKITQALDEALATAITWNVSGPISPAS